MARNKEELQRDYNIKCAELGQAIYKLHAIEAEVEATDKQVTQLKRELRYLNAEASRLEGKAPVEAVAEPVQEASSAGQE